MSCALVLRGLVFGLLSGLAGCFGDETVRGYGGADRVWVLDTLDGAPFGARATLTFPETGRIAGAAPCNRYFAAMDAPYPWFETGPIGATRRACPELQAEGAFFTALAAMRLAEVLGDVLILSNPDTGSDMVFRAASTD